MSIHRDISGLVIMLLPQMLPLALLGLVVFGWWYRRYLGLRYGTGVVLALAGSAGAFVWAWASHGSGFERGAMVIHQRGIWNEIGYLVQGAAYVCCILFALGLAAKLYRAVVLDRLTDRERLPNGAGLRAWLAPMGWISVAGVAGGAYLAMGWPLWGTGAGALALLLAYPVSNIVLKGGADVLAEAGDDWADERRRVLALVESGKISGEDGAELIAALGQNRPAPPEERGGFSMGKRLMLLGALVLLVGFCLPWFMVDVGAAMREAMKTMRPASEGFLYGPGGAKGSVFTVPGSGAALPLSLTDQVAGELTVSVRGGDLQHALGWFILGLALAAGTLPLLWLGNVRNRPVQRGICLATLIGGTVILIYVASSVLGTSAGVHMGLGLALAVLGYGVIWAGALREYVPARRTAGRTVLAAQVSP
jgi:hypothetical protein